MISGELPTWCIFTEADWAVHGKQKKKAGSKQLEPLQAAVSAPNGIVCSFADWLASIALVGLATSNKRLPGPKATQTMPKPDKSLQMISWQRRNRTTRNTRKPSKQISLSGCTADNPASRHVACRCLEGRFRGEIKIKQINDWLRRKGLSVSELSILRIVFCVYVFWRICTSRIRHLAFTVPRN